MGLLTSLGRTASQLGTKLNLPELGISEALGYHPLANYGNNGAPSYPAQSRVASTDDGSSTDNTAPGGYYGGGGGGTAAPAYSQADLANINDALGRLGTQESIGRDNLDRSYNATRDSLQNGLNAAEGQFNTTLARTQQDNVDAKNTIDTGVRQGLTGLQRLLGAHGAGNSSAANILAPYAAGLAGNSQRQQVNKNYGRNVDDLNTGIASTREQYRGKFGELDADKNNKLNSLLSNLSQTRAQLLGQKQSLTGGNGLTADINGLKNQIDQYGRVSVFDPGQVDYKTPTLQDYAYDRTGGPQTQAQTSADQNVGVYSNLLQEKKKLEAV